MRRTVGAMVSEGMEEGAIAKKSYGADPMAVKKTPGRVNVEPRPLYLEMGTVNTDPSPVKMKRASPVKEGPPKKVRKGAVEGRFPRETTGVNCRKTWEFSDAGEGIFKSRAMISIIVDKKDGMIRSFHSHRSCLDRLLGLFL